MGEIHPVIFLERKWSGNRPWYTLSINQEGTVEYNGIRNVKTMGKHLYSIKREELNELIDTAKAVYFFSLRDQYDAIVKSHNSCQTTISVSFDTRYKIIKYAGESKVPRSLEMLVKKIERITNITQWI